MLSPSAFATGGGNALPICRYCEVFRPANLYWSSSDHPWIRAAISTVRRGIVWLGGRASSAGGASATPFPSTPSLAQPSFARVGPRSAPPCFLLPPTKVGPTSFAISRHASACFHPRAAMSEYSASPTVVRARSSGTGQRKNRMSSALIAMSTKRGLNCGTPKSEACSSFHSPMNPKSSRRSRMRWRYAAKRGAERPRTFSSMIALGRMTGICSIAQAKRSRSSEVPSCLPAAENGGHGTPPARSDTPAKSSGRHTAGSATSPTITGTPRFCLSVKAAVASSSTATVCSKPALCSPRD